MTTKLTQIFLVLILFGTAALFATTTAHAVVLEQAFDVSVRNASVAEVGGQARVSLSASNNSIEDIESIRFGLRLQTGDGAVAYEYVHREEFTLPAGESTPISFAFTLPSSLSGTHSAIAIAKSTYGMTIAAGFAGDVELSTKGSAKDAPSIIDCSILNKVDLEFWCDTTKSISYKLFKGSAYGSAAGKGEITETNKSKNGMKFKLPSTLEPGKYAVVFSVGGATHSLPIAFETARSWVAFDRATSLIFGDDSYSASLYFSGKGRANERGFIYGVADSAGTVCTSGSVDLESLKPNVRHISGELNSRCIDPQFVGVLYDGRNSDGSYNTVEMVGDVDPVALLADFAKRKQGTQLFAGADFAKTATLIIVVLLIALVLILLLRQNKGSDGATVTTLLFLFVFAMPLGASAQTFMSANDTFTVNMDKTVYKTSDDISFLFGFEKISDGTKPIGGLAKVSIDGGPYQEITSFGDTTEMRNVSLPPQAQGDHTLHFLVPGDFFDLSAGFDLGRFDSLDAEFDVSFTVSDGEEPEEPPNINGCNYALVGGTVTKQCVLNGAFGSCEEPADCPDIPEDDLLTIDQKGTCTYSGGNYTKQFTFNVSDTTPAGTQAAIRIDWDNDGTYENRYPLGSGFRAAPFSVDLSIIGPSQDQSVAAVLIDSDNNPLAFAAQTVHCSIPEEDTTPPYEDPFDTDGVYDPSLRIWATSPFVRRDDTTTINWQTEDIKSCNITSNGNTDSWIYIALPVGSRPSTNITQETTYLLSCTTARDKSIATTTKVRLAPSWGEY